VTWDCFEKKINTTQKGDGSRPIRFRVKIESTRTGPQITLITQIAQMEECEEGTGVEAGGGIRDIELGSMQKCNDKTKERMQAGRGKAEAGCARGRGGRGRRDIG